MTHSCREWHIVVRVISIYTSDVALFCQYCQLLNPLFSICLQCQYEQTCFSCASNRVSTCINSCAWDSTYDVNVPLLYSLENAWLLAQSGTGCLLPCLCPLNVLLRAECLIYTNE